MDEQSSMPSFIQTPADMEALRIGPIHSAVHIAWGDATIIFHEDGRLTLEGFPTPDAAAKAFWRAIAKWAPAGIQVTLPDGYGEEP